MKYLLVVAHPDDEVLGAGASIFKWTRRGDVVDVAIMCSEANARSFRPDDSELNQDIVDSLKFLGINKKYDANFPNIEMNTIPHIKLVQFIESVIKMSSPDIIITHHPADTNNDHLHTSMACQEAIRLFQRRPEINRIKEFWFMEVPSCTEWAVNNSINLFRPNCFVEVGEGAIEAKIKALGMYRGVMRPYPHPRSAEYIKGLAAVRGSQWGQVYSESFEVSIRAE